MCRPVLQYCLIIAKTKVFIVTVVTRLTLSKPWLSGRFTLICGVNDGQCETMVLKCQRVV